MQEYLHNAHGLVVRSFVELPEYVRASGGDHADLTVSIFPQTQPITIGDGHAATPEGFSIWWETVGSFLIQPDGTIGVCRKDGVPDSLLRLPLLGSVTAISLHFLGKIVLHGNALAVNGAGIVIVGEKGQGKSTLTAALLQRGHRLLADDVSSLDLRASDATVHRGCLQLKLWPDSVEKCLARSAEDFAPIHQWSEKKSVPAHEYACDHASVPLKKIYVLAEGDAVSGEIVPVHEAWREILSHSYPSRFGSVLLQGLAGARHFEQCTRLVCMVPLVRLRRPKSFASLESVVEFIENDTV